MILILKILRRFNNCRKIIKVKYLEFKHMLSMIKIKRGNDKIDSFNILIKNLCCAVRLNETNNFQFFRQIVQNF